MTALHRFLAAILAASLLVGCGDDGGVALHAGPRLADAGHSSTAARSTRGSRRPTRARRRPTWAPDAGPVDGDAMDPAFCWMKDRHARRPLPALVHDHAIDDSPCGVRGLAGNARDRCTHHEGEMGTGRSAVARGGHWDAAADACRAAARGTRRRLPRLVHRLPPGPPAAGLIVAARR